MCVRECVGLDESDSQKGGCTALVFAAQEGHADCVQLLLDAGANKEATGDVRIIFWRF